MANADGSVIIKADIDDKQAQRELNALTKKIDALQEKLNSKKSNRDFLANRAADLTDSLAKAQEKLAHMKSGDEFFTSFQVERQAEEVKNLRGEWKRINTKLDTQNDKIAEAERAIEREKEKAGQLAAQIVSAKEKTTGFSAAAEEADKRLKKFSDRVKTLARRVLVFSLITRALRSLKDYMWEAIQTNDEAMAAVGRLKGALRTLAQPILNVLIPAFTVLVNVITQVVNALSKLVAMIFGTTADEAARAAENLYNQQKALSGVGGAAKKASKSLASFDEINKLSGDTSSGGGGAGAPNFVSSMKDQISAVTSLFVGAGLLALGAILTFSGINIPLGIALMAIGALTIYSAVSENWGAIKEALQGELAGIVAIVSVALLALGAIFVFGGVNVPLGLGLLVLGAVGLAATIAANWGVIKEALQGEVGQIVAVVSTALLALGALLLFTGAGIALGLGLILVGAAGLAAAIVPNWESIVEALQGPLGEVIGKISAALLVLGVVLLFTGAGVPLGLGLIAVGAVGLAAAIAPNWNFLLDKLKGVWEDIKAWFNNTVIGGLLKAKEKIAEWGHNVIGKVKDVLGIHSPSTETTQMGDYMMQGLANGINENQGLVLEQFQLVLDNIDTEFLAWEENFMTGFSKFSAEFNKAWLAHWSLTNRNFVIQWNYIIESFQRGINNVIDGLNRLVSAANSLSDLTGKHYGSVSRVNIAKLPIPKLATGAVIPPNREFMAVLGDQKSGTNIETPLATMVQAFKQALAESGYSGSNEAVLVLDKDVLGKVVYRLNKAEGTRIGVNLSEVQV